MSVGPDPLTRTAVGPHPFLGGAALREESAAHTWNHIECRELGTRWACTC